MPDWISNTLTTLAFCWRLDRRDGIVLGFTSHDRDLIVDRLAYRAAPGMVPSAIATSSGLQAGSVDVSGIVSSSGISDDDLMCGRWDDASLSLFAADWTNPDAETLPLAEGRLGTISQNGQQFTAELRGAATLLDRPVAEETSPECRASLGDTRCRVDMRGRSELVVVSSGVDRTLILSTPVIADAFALGRLRWLDGANAGLDAVILNNSATSLTLRHCPAFPLEPGTRADVWQGCDRRFSTCITRFANAENFRGEPHLPGNDLLARYVV